MIRAIVRLEREAAVTAALAKSGFPALTKWEVVGRGKQSGVQLGDQIYDALAKCLLMVVAHDDQVTEIVQTIEEAAGTSNPGDGKIFVSPVSEAFTIRNRKAEL